jgi:hypothetical protein
MPSIRCPSCQRALALRDHLRGTAVQCPMCRTTFEAPSEGAAPAPARVSSPPPAPPVLPPAPSLEVEPSPAVRSAVHWLEAAVAFEGGVVVCCSGPPVLLGLLVEDVPPAVMIGLVLLWGATLGGVAFGSVRLRRRRNYVVAATGGVLAFLLALLGLVHGAFLARAALRDWHANEMEGLTLFVSAGLGLLAAATAAVAGVKTFTALSDPEVRRSFR